MLKRMQLLTVAAALAMTAMPLVAAQSQSTTEETAWRAEKVRKEIVTLPFYSVFDHVLISVEGDRVTLDGSVYRPSMKKSVERVAARVEGVNEVVNNVEIQPTSFYDDRLRVALVRTLYSNQVLNRYGIQSVPPIHIIVKNGQVTLEGVVNREMEKNVAGIVANGVSGVFSVKNNLRVEMM